MITRSMARRGDGQALAHDGKMVTTTMCPIMHDWSLFILPQQRCAVLKNALLKIVDCIKNLLYIPPYCFRNACSISTPL